MWSYFSIYNPPRKSETRSKVQKRSFMSGGLKENGQNPDTMEAKTVTSENQNKNEIGQKMGEKWLKMDFWATFSAQYQRLAIP